MVLFTELEALFLLDLYLHFRANPQNLTSGGVLLKMHARDELTRAMNKCFRRETQWTESQVTVKFKNLRSEYIELQWLNEQPGFHLDGTGMSDDWWGDIKARRPKVHAFKGKLPWPYYQKMAVIVGDAPASSNVTEPATAQRITQLLSELASENGQSPRQPAGSQLVGTNAAMAALAATVASSGGGRTFPHQQPAPQQPMLAPATTTTSASVSASGKRQRDGSSSNKRPRKRVSDMTEYERVRQQSLVKSVEHGSKAAADMAKGFNDLVSVYQHQMNKCVQAEAHGDHGLNASEERQIISSLAMSLEKSSQATAEMAKGYRDLVSFFVQESEDVHTTAV